MAQSNVKLTVDARGAISALNNTSLATNKLSTAAKGTTASLTGASTAAKGLGASLAATMGPIIALGAAFSTVNSALRSFSDREKDVNILRQGLKNLDSGTASLNRLQEVANRLGNQTLFDQEDFTRGFNLLTSFRNIGVDAYERVAQSAADVAQVNQVDVSTSFMQLAKALQDPERNLSALNRSGIAFTKTQTEMIKTLMNTNKVGEAHKMILDIVEESYSKLAQAAASGFAGDIDSLGEAWRDFGEILGKAVIPVLIPVVQGLTKLVETVTAFAQSPLAKTVTIFTAFALAVKGVVTAIGLLSAAVTILGPKLSMVGATSLIASTGLQGMAAATLLATTQTSAYTVALGALKLATVATGFGLIAIAIGGIATALIKANEEQKKYNDLIKTGTDIEIQKELSRLLLKQVKLNARLATAKHFNNRRAINSVRTEKQILDKQIETLKEKSAQLTRNRLEQEASTNEIIRQEREAEKLKQAYKRVGDSIATNIRDSLVEAVKGTKTLGEMATSILNDIADAFLRIGITQFLKASPFGSFFSGLSFANGGRPPVGKASLVGERGPEIFVPSTSGTIIPNHRLGGGTSVVVNVDASGNKQVEGDDTQARMLGGAISAAVQAELVRQKMPGGILYG